MKKVKFLGLGFLSAILLMMFGILAFWIEAVEAKSVFAETSNKSASVALFSVEANDTCVYFDEQGVQPLFIQYGATGVQFPVPVSEEGKIFQGWYYNDRQYTDSEGNLIGEWDIQEEEITLKAKWEYEDEFYTIMTQYNNITYYYSIENGWNTNPANVVKRGDKLESSNSFETDFRKLEIIRNQSLTIL